VIFHLFAHNVPVEERSRAFGYLVAAGSVGQVVASVVSSFIIFILYHINIIICEILYFIKSMYFYFFSQICPYLSWQTGFYLFGSIGILWTFLWLMLYQETNSQDEIPLFVPKVNIPLHLAIYFLDYFIIMLHIN